jgi:hypothetical protein
MRANWQSHAFRLTVSLGVFAITLLVSFMTRDFARYSILHPALTLLPVFPAIWAGYETACLVGSLDELQKRIALEIMAFCLANLALISLAIGLIQIGSPEYYNIACNLPIILIFGVIGYFLVQRRYQ